MSRRRPQWARWRRMAAQKLHAGRLTALRSLNVMRVLIQRNGRESLRWVATRSREMLRAVMAATRSALLGAARWAVRPSVLRGVNAALAAAGAIALIASEVSNLRTVHVITATLERTTAGSQHAYVGVLLGAGALVLIARGVARSNRASYTGLMFVGLLGLVLALALDLPSSHSTGRWSGLYEGARASAGVSTQLALVGSALVIVGSLGLLRLAQPTAPADRGRPVSEPAGQPL